MRAGRSGWNAAQRGSAPLEIRVQSQGNSVVLLPRKVKRCARSSPATPDSSRELKVAQQQGGASRCGTQDCERT